MKRTGLILLISGFWLLVSGYYTNTHAQDETLEIITYYPAPYGVYQEVQIQRGWGNFLTLRKTDVTPNTSWLFHTPNPAGANPSRLEIAYNNGATTTWGILSILPSGFIGIGTVNPTEILGLNGDDWRRIKMERRTSSGGGWPLVIQAGGCFYGGTDFSGGDLYLRSGISTGDKGSRIHFSTATPGASGALDNNPSIKMVIINQGNVGIGDVSPDTTLHVRRDHDADTLIKIENNNTGANSTEGIQFNNEYAGLAGIYLYDDNHSSYPNQMSIFNNRTSGLITFSTQGTEKVRIANNGNVGIGISPTAKLHVNGNIKAVLNGVTDGGAGIWDMDYDSNTDEIGYDVAELFESNEEVEPGDVLVVGENGKLEKSKLANSTKVAGIVSSAPAILFEGSTLEIAPEPFSFQKGYKPPLTVAGRVLCNVSTENGSVNPGDLLATSSTPGYAMKATDPKIGTVVGKALEPLKEEKGKILVLVCLM